MRVGGATCVPTLAIRAPALATRAVKIERGPREQRSNPAIHAAEQWGTNHDERVTVVLLDVLLLACLCRR